MIETSGTIDNYVKFQKRSFECDSHTRESDIKIYIRLT